MTWHCPGCALRIRLVREAYESPIPGDDDPITREELAEVVDADCPHLPDGSSIDVFIAAHPQGGTLEEVGEALGVSYEWIRNYEMRAIRALRRRGTDLAILADALGYPDAEEQVKAAVWKKDRQKRRPRRKQPKAA